MDVDTLAKALHEAGREAVLTNKVHKKDGAPVGKIIFKEWDEISKDAREGRRIQARYLLERHTIVEGIGPFRELAAIMGKPDFSKEKKIYIDLKTKIRIKILEQLLKKIEKIEEKGITYDQISILANTLGML